MLRFTQPLTVTVAEFGTVDRGAVGNALGVANQVQRAFTFDWQAASLKFNPSRYRLPNGGVDLVRAAEDGETSPFPRPLVLVTSLPFGVPEKGEVPEEYSFSDNSVDWDRHVAVVSTYLWERLPATRAKRHLQTYLLLMLSAYVLERQSTLSFHGETLGCIMDACDKASDIDRCLRGRGICESCEKQLHADLTAGRISVEQVAAMTKLLNRARGRKQAFIVMPFRKEFDRVHATLRGTLEGKGWMVRRGDESATPRTITLSVLREILASDLVVADISGKNPNVFYELGLAHATGIDTVLVSQQKHVPFDINVERAVFYKPGRGGLAKLAQNLDRQCGSGRFRP